MNAPADTIELEQSDAAIAQPTPAISVNGLTLAYRSRGAQRTAVRDVSFDVPEGQSVALVGESGSGKTTIASAVGGLLADNAVQQAGSIRLLGRDVTNLSAQGWRALRGRILGYVPQDPLGSLDPLQTVGSQITEAVVQARSVSETQAKVTALELLDAVHIADAARKYESYPHELSGGQLQRVLIAGALAGEPRLLIADEPTSALDVTVQKRILDLLADLQRELSLSVLFITHDLSLAGERSDRVVVLRRGRVVEQGSSEQVLARPSAPYTRQLFRDVPALLPDKYIEAKRRLAHGRRGDEKAIVVHDVDKAFDGERKAVEGASLAVARGELHALVGESGSGKTTLARIIAGLVGFDAGEVRVNGVPRTPQPPVINADPSALQLVYQNPLAVLDPRRDVRALVAEPLEIGGTGRGEARRQAEAVLENVGLAPELWRRRAAQLSGGQRQRVAIARALVLSPAILVLDEPTSALDVTVQAQIIDLLFELREANDLTLLFISHDLSLVRQIADTVTVLQDGRVVESGPTDELFAAPSHPYTRALIDAIPSRVDTPAPHP
ncbi:MAG: ABC transporter ATP-binding protein [Microbacterium sp.]